MQILVFPERKSLSLHAAKMFAAQIEAVPESVLGLATGSTPLGLYQELALQHREGLNLSGVTTFNLDEYVGIDPDHEASFNQFMKTNLFQHVNIPAAQTDIPRGHAGDLAAECSRYEQAIRNAGGIDLQLLGIGHNGHIGFNEPNTPFETVTHVVTLAAKTRVANARYFGAEPSQVPEKAISAGIKTIMQAKKIILLAAGEDKAETVAAAVEGPVTTSLPASVLQLHPQVWFLLDTDAAGKLSSNNPDLLRA